MYTLAKEQSEKSGLGRGIHTKTVNVVHPNDNDDGMGHEKVVIWLSLCSHVHEMDFDLEPITKTIFTIHKPDHLDSISCVYFH